MVCRRAKDLMPRDNLEPPRRALVQLIRLRPTGMASESQISLETMGNSLKSNIIEFIYLFKEGF